MYSSIKTIIRYKSMFYGNQFSQKKLEIEKSDFIDLRVEEKGNLEYDIAN
jgi:hypothetical protein